MSTHGFVIVRVAAPPAEDNSSKSALAIILRESYQALTPHAAALTTHTAMDGLSIFALILLILVVLSLAYGMIIIHDIPYHIALKRQHPHADAIHVTGWVSLFTLHAIWPFLWIWATVYNPERGYGTGRIPPEGAEGLVKRVADLEARLADLESRNS